MLKIFCASNAFGLINIYGFKFQSEATDADATGKCLPPNQIEINFRAFCGPAICSAGADAASNACF